MFTKRPELVGLGRNRSDVTKREKCTGRRDSLEECGVLRVKGKNETRFMSPLLCQLSYTAHTNRK